MARRVDVGLALGPDRLCAVVARPGQPADAAWRRTLRPPDPGAASWEALQEALQELRQELGAAGGTLFLAVLPPAVQLRRVELPALAEPELRRILARDVGRFFPGTHPPQVLGLAPLRHEGEPPFPWLTAAAPADWIAAAVDAARLAGWKVVGMVPAHAAWAAALAELWPRSGGETVHLAILEEERLEVLRVEHGHLALVRRLPAARDPARAAEALAVLGGGEAQDLVPVALVAAAEARGPLEEELRLRAVPLLEFPDSAAPPLAADALAAAFAARARVPELLPQGEFARRRHRRTRLTASVAAASVLLLLGAARLYLWGVERELEALAERRRQIRGRVAAAVVARESLTVASARASAINGRGEAARRWSIVLADLGPHLPPHAHLTTFRAEGDTVVLGGVASDALEVVRSLHAAPGVAEVRTDAPVRREIGETGAPTELFDVSVRLRGIPTAPEPRP